MSSIARQEFASAVAAAVVSVQHLSREVDGVLVGLREALAEDDPPLAPLRGTLVRTGKVGSGRLVLRYEYGGLFAPPLDDADLEDEDDTEGDDDGDGEDRDDDDADRPRRKRPLEILSDQPLLAVRVVVFDIKNQAGFEPHISWAVMSDWATGPKGVPNKGDRFAIGSFMLRRLPRALRAADGAKTKRITTAAIVKTTAAAKKSRDRRLSCKLVGGIESQPLVELDSAEAVERLAGRMRDMWRGVVDNG